MKVTKRYLVLCSKNVVQNPKNFGVHLEGLKSEGSPSFLNRGAAQGFADILAKRNRGESYYIAEIVAGTVQFTEPADPGLWVDAANQPE